MFRKIAIAGLKTGAILSATTLAAIMLAGRRETGAPWSAVNAICHIVDGDDVSQPSDFSTRESVLGAALNSSIMFAWAGLYEAALVMSGKSGGVVPAAAAATAAYVIDYKLVPPRFTPGIEKKVSRGSVAAIYAVLGVTLALSPFWNRYDDASSTETSPE